MHRMKSFSDQMRDFDQRRRHARIKDEELAEESGVACATISRYRHGRQQPSVDRWNELNGALDKLIARRAAELTSLAS
jgi:transcriptional regulator with XRE-family HTH domain